MSSSFSMLSHQPSTLSKGHQGHVSSFSILPYMVDFSRGLLDFFADFPHTYA